MTGGFASIESVRPEQSGRYRVNGIPRCVGEKRGQTHREVPILTILGHPSRDFSNRTHSCTIQQRVSLRFSRTCTPFAQIRGKKDGAEQTSDSPRNSMRPRHLSDRPLASCRTEEREHDPLGEQTARRKTHRDRHRRYTFRRTCQSCTRRRSGPALPVARTSRRSGYRTEQILSQRPELAGRAVESGQREEALLTIYRHPSRTTDRSLQVQRVQVSACSAASM